MKCIDCGKDAVCLHKGGCSFLSFAFCLDCVSKRIDKKFRLITENIKVEDIWDKIWNKVDSETKTTYDKEDCHTSHNTGIH